MMRKSRIEEGVGVLRARLEDEGYLWLCGVLDREVVMEARRAVLEGLAEHEGVLDLEAGKVEDAILQRDCGISCVPFMEGRQRDARVLCALENDALREIVGEIIGDNDSVRTFDYKWLRAVPSEKFTGVHVDSVYMGRGSQRLVTTWLPLGDIHPRLGALAVLERSHTSPALSTFRSTYGKLDVERDGLVGTGWFTENPDDLLGIAAKTREVEEPSSSLADLRWLSGVFEAGDVVLFGMQLAHMSTANLTKRARLSCDVRWQPVADPIDERYVGAAADPADRVVAGLRALDEGSEQEKEAMERKRGKGIREFRKEWGLE